MNQATEQNSLKGRNVVCIATIKEDILRKNMDFTKLKPKQPKEIMIKCPKK